MHQTKGAAIKYGRSREQRPQTFNHQYVQRQREDSHHVVAVHDHEDVLLRNLLCGADSRVNLVHEHVVEVGAFPVELVGLLHTVAHIEHVAVT